MIPIPDVNAADCAFGNIKHMPKFDTLPDEFRRGWHRGNVWCDAISSWFYGGAKATPDGIQIDGKAFKAKSGVDPKKALSAIKACMASWEPKHEHKIAGCGFLLSEWFEVGQ
jgi:hypothetical protein